MNAFPGAVPTVVIKNVQCGLVLDGSGFQVQLQSFQGLPSQMWGLEPTGNGFYFIVNKATGNVLDIEEGADYGNNVITFDRHGEENQQWLINPDNTITSAAEGGNNLALDVPDSDFTPGCGLIVYEKHGEGNQQFSVEYQ